MSKHGDPTDDLPPGKSKAEAIKEFNKLMEDTEKKTGAKQPRIGKDGKKK